MKKINNTQFLWLLLLAEFLWFFFFRKDLGFFVSPLFYMGAGFAYYFYYRHKAYLFASAETSGVKISGLYYAAVAAGFAVMFWLTHTLIVAYPLDVKNSDIIPLIQEIYVKRFLHGENVYALYEGFNYGTFVPNYMPFHWGPFILTPLLGLEPRYVHTLMYALAILIMLRMAYKQSDSNKEFYLKSALPFLFFIFICWKQGKDYANTVELLIAAWYVVLACSLFSSRKIIRALGLAVTMLSRYSLAFWLPVWAFVQFRVNVKSFIITSLILTAFVLGCYILPFVWKAPHVLSQGADLWVDAALNEWDGQEWQEPGSDPFQLYQGLGFASWFHTFYPGVLKAKLLACRNAMVIISLLTSLFLMIKGFKVKEEEQSVYLLLSLKFSLTVFFAFSFVPYVYLYWVPLVLSIFIAMRMRWRLS